MATQHTITEHASGDDWKLNRTTSSLPTDGIETARIIVKDNYTTLDSAAIIDKTITTSYQSGVGGITDNGSGDGQAAYTFELVAEETENLLAGRSYAYRIILIMANTGLRNTPEKGNIIPQ